MKKKIAILLCCVFAFFAYSSAFGSPSMPWNDLQRLLSYIFNRSNTWTASQTFTASISATSSTPSTVTSLESGTSTYKLNRDMSLTANRVYVVTAAAGSPPKGSLSSITVPTGSVFILDGTKPGALGGNTSGVSAACSGNSIYSGEGSAYTAGSTVWVNGGTGISGYMLTFIAIPVRGGGYAWRLTPTNVPVYSTP